MTTHNAYFALTLRRACKYNLVKKIGCYDDLCKAIDSIVGLIVTIPQRPWPRDRDFHKKNGGKIGKSSQPGLVESLTSHRSIDLDATSFKVEGQFNFSFIFVHFLEMLQR